MVHKARSAAALMLTATLVVTSCSGNGSFGSSSPAESSTAVASSSSSSPKSTTFTSKHYGYSVTLPPGWNANQAADSWDVHAGYGLNQDSFTADQFGSASGPVSFAVAAPWTQSLAEWARFWIEQTTHYHEMCPPKPNTRDAVSIGGEPGSLLGYNCGILVNIAVTVRRGVAYCFTFVDDSVPAATDPTDRDTFLAILRSVQFSA